jgi:hypothetical protein
MSARGMLARMMNQPKLKSKLFFPRDENKGVIFPPINETPGFLSSLVVGVEIATPWSVGLFVIIGTK